MVKKALKRILSLGCIAALFMTTPGTTLLANNLQEGAIVSDIHDDSSVASVTKGSVPEVIEEDLTTESEDLVEDIGYWGDVSISEEPLIYSDDGSEHWGDVPVSEEPLIYSDDESSVIVDDSSVATERNNEWIVGDGVTATLVKEGNKDVLYFDSKEGTLWNDWHTKIGDRLKIVDIIKLSESSTVMYLPENSKYLFGQESEWDGKFSNLDEIVLDKVDTSNVKDMSYMFSYCSGLTSLNLSGFDTSKVTSMSSMFSGCSGLTTLDLSKFDTSKVTDMSDMFYGCSGLTTLDLSKFDTSKVARMPSMFAYCSGLTSLDLSEFNTLNVIYMSSMFHGCTSLTSLDLRNFDTSSVNDMSYMFCECSNLTSLNLSEFDTSNVMYMTCMFSDCSSLTKLDLKSFDTSNVTMMSDEYSVRGMFSGCTNLTDIDISSFDTSNISDFRAMFSDCRSLKKLNLEKLDTSHAKYMSDMFSGCSGLTTLDLSGFDTSKVTGMDNMLSNCSSLSMLDLSGFDTSSISDKYCGDIFGCLFSSSEVTWNSLNILKTPKSNNQNISLPRKMCDDEGNEYTQLPILSKSITLKPVIISSTPTIALTPTVTPRPTITPRPVITAIPKRNISLCSVSGLSQSYGYSGKAYTPTVTVKVDGVTLTKDKDYTVDYLNNKKPGTAFVVIVGMGNCTGVKIKTFEIVDCASSIVSGKTYQLVPKNNSDTAVCAIGGKMVNNTKVYITDRGNSESQKFKAVKNSDGTWKFINAKCELALAVQQNSSALGAGLVLYDQTTRSAQNWKLSKKSDNSFAIINSVTGYSIAVSDKSAVKGTTLSMAETASVGQQRFYMVETSAVSAPFDGTKSIRAAKNKNFGLNIASSSKEDGANVNLYTYTNTNTKKFKIVYSGGGYYRLVNVNSGLCLTIKGNSNADGANIIQSKWKGYSSQRWKITKNSDGTVTFTSMLGTVLHLSGNITVNNRNVHARKEWPTTAQKWYLN